MKFRFLLLGPVLIYVLSGCSTRPELKGRDTAMRLQEEKPALSDDLNLEGLTFGVKQNIARLEARKKLKTMTFGSRSISKSDYVAALQDLLDVIKEASSKQEVLQWVHQNFDFMEIYGDRKWGEVFMTSYYDPVIQGSKKKTKTFSQPLYKAPKDLVSIQMHKFFDTFPRLRDEMNPPHEQKSQGFVIRGRYDQKNSRVVPYFSRKEIDEENSLKGKKLEMVWVKPIDSFFLQIQGSGVVEFANGERMRVGYAAQNGHPYVAIGKFLLDDIPIEKMSMQAIAAHLETLSDKEMQGILNKNPSYVFFRPLKSKSITYFGTEVVAGRTIATDYRYFPKGALAYLEFESPVFGKNHMEPQSWEKTSRLVLDQDTGGAIRGAHRLDLYWGEGKDAARSAGVMRHHGKLSYLLPNAEWLAKRSRLSLKKM